ncbi:hypothetical protein [Serpens gallinarum]|jgi:hypothetical protein|uniref:Uncharacterized protein n=1 Tax=Serpens gallinarum TaxID=2763075 RepID=A0ABR8TNB2_9PSED|nr:hypothetical protein [Serpens gallinarum]MBD7977010.1 hypothetical protein [Serpens gallinarum]
MMQIPQIKAAADHAAQASPQRRWLVKGAQDTAKPDPWINKQETLAYNQRGQQRVRGAAEGRRLTNIKVF